jgi:hypothetical protein
MVSAVALTDRRSQSQGSEVPSPGCDVGGTVQDANTKQAKTSDVIFPVAVGAVFLVVLVVGAIIG